ncbi:ABC transporter substrate-binding protein [Chitinophaga horti]|uniref:ABC transporter substrate-binding protein n=1 Tax=Chitinophaga horti TaxID=2920382 RepID=A0ABY6J7K1_9BACT|nr:ABC transporter substrate-binding protein [Chitinophaga horti]UYQ95577.1 ABC transporter substrate-binding protein [Chitinophaga horti]
MRKFKIGMLIPYSGVFPNLREDFMDGIELGMGECFYEVEWLQEFIHMGDVSKVQHAMQKLALFDRVHAITGILNNNVIKACLPEIDKHKVPLIACNLGARIPDEGFSHPNLFYNSMHLWKSQWVIGKWTQTMFGGTPSLNLSVYEGGYDMHVSYKSGAAAAGADAVHLNILQLQQQETDTSPLIDHLQAQRPRHVHVLLTGREGAQFLRRFRQQGMHLEMDVSVNPYLNLQYDPYLTAGMYHATTWYPGLETEENKDFVATYKSRFEELPPPFAVLGYETGLALAEAINQCGTVRQAARLSEQLSQVCVQGPRGEVRLGTQPLQATSPVYVLRSANQLIGADDGVCWTDADLAAGAAQSLSGWQNPYLCV